MLPRKFRLPATDIANLMRYGRRITENDITLIYHQILQTSKTFDKQMPLPRFAFIVSAKADKRAVVRNKIRRLLRESVHHLVPGIRPGVTGVFIGYKRLVGVTLNVMESRVQELFQKTGMTLPENNRSAN